MVQFFPLPWEWAINSKLMQWIIITNIVFKRSDIAVLVEIEIGTDKQEFWYVKISFIIKSLGSDAGLWSDIAVLGFKGMEITLDCMHVVAPLMWRKIAWRNRLIMVHGLLVVWVEIVISWITVCAFKVYVRYLKKINVNCCSVNVRQVQVCLIGRFMRWKAEQQNKPINLGAAIPVPGSENKGVVISF